MVAQTTNGKFITINSGDIIIDENNNTYFITGEVSMGRIVALQYHPRHHVFEQILLQTGKFPVIVKTVNIKNLENPASNWNAILESNNIPKEFKSIFAERPNWSEMLEEMDIPVEDILQSYEKALLLIHYYEKILESIFADKQQEEKEEKEHDDTNGVRAEQPNRLDPLEGTVVQRVTGLQESTAVEYASDYTFTLSDPQRSFIKGTGVPETIKPKKGKRSNTKKTPDF